MLGLHCFVQAFSGYGEGELLFVVVHGLLIAVVQFLPYVQLFETPIDCSTLGFPVLHCLPEPAQACVHWVSDAIQPSPSLSSPSPPAIHLSQHQSFPFLIAVGFSLQSAGSRLAALAVAVQPARDGWLASLTQWTWVWAGSGRWWSTGKPSVLQALGSSWTRVQTQVPCVGRQIPIHSTTKEV